MWLKQQGEGAGFVYTKNSQASMPRVWESFVSYYEFCWPGLAAVVSTAKGECRSNCEICSGSLVSLQSSQRSALLTIRFALLDLLCWMP
jgi:hypothetical protein